MGGFGSGRRHGRPVVEDCVVLNLAFMLRETGLTQDTGAHGYLEYTCGLRLHFDMRLEAKTGWLKLTYGTTVKASVHQVEMFEVELKATDRRPFGGQRWWFVCPRLKKNVTKLFLPPGAIHFASREGHQLGYRSQRLGKTDQALLRIRRLRARLGDTGRKGSIITKPKWQRWPSFQRKIQAVHDAEQRHGELWLNDLEKTRFGQFLQDKIRNRREMPSGS